VQVNPQAVLQGQFIKHDRELLQEESRTRNTRGFGKDGLEAARRIKKFEKNVNIPIAGLRGITLMPDKTLLLS
jgi:hypothetical protein